jgi:hypothetical protein
MMKKTKTNYTAKAFFLIMLAFFIGGYHQCQAQSKQELKGIPIEESGVSVEEYNSIMKHQVIELDLSENKSFVLELIKVNSNTNDAHMIHTLLPPCDDGVRVVEKNNPNKPQWSAIPYTILREEDYNENN